MQPGSEFSLAAALWGWPPAPGHAAPDQQAPDAWVLHFREHHAASDPAVLSGLLTACPAGRDWVLEAAPRVTLTLDTTAEQTHAQWQHRMSTLSSALGARGSRPLRLNIACDGSSRSSAAGCVLPRLLCGLDGAVTELVLVHRARTGAFPPSVTFLWVLAPAFAPHLTTLSLDPCPCALPPSDLLPQLRSLSVSTPNFEAGGHQLEREIVSSIAPYTTQLTSLVVKEGRGLDGHIEWPDMTPATPSHTLASLSMDFIVDTPLVWLATEKFPALQSLCATGLHLEADHSSKVWGVRELRLSRQVCWHHGSDDQSQLYSLPRCKQGASITVRVLEVNLFSDAQGLSANVVERLSECHLNCKRLTVHVAQGVEDSEEPAALRATLTQLCDGLHTTGDVTLCLSGWEWDARLLQRYVQAMPALAERGVVRHHFRRWGPLTDELFGIVLEASAQITGLCVSSLALQSDTHANTPWPWDELSISSFDITDLCKLPDPAGERVPREVSCREVILSERMLQVGADRITSRQRHVELLFVGTSGNCLRLRCPQDGSSQAAALQAQLSVLRAVRVGRVTSEERVPAYMEGWPLHLMTNKALEGLPEWALPKFAHEK